MTLGDWTYVLLAVNPVGGVLAAIPWGYFVQHYSVPVMLVTAPPLAYVQVLVVDGAWSQLNRWPAWQRFVEKHRGPRTQRLLASGGAFWPVYLAAPVIGPAIIMALMRYAGIRQRHIALPLVASLVSVVSVVLVLCHLVPEWFTDVARR